MPKKLVFIADKSESYINFQKKLILDEWKVSNQDIKIIESLSSAGGMTLFGNSDVSLFDVKTSEQLAQLVTDFQKFLKDETIDSKVGVGLIITTMIPRTSTKKIEKFIKDYGGEVLVTASNEKDSLSSKIIGSLNLNKETKDFVISYVGDDYESCISLARSIREIPKEHQSKITSEDIYLRMPQSEGGVPPWELEPFIFKGDYTGVIKTFRRISQNSHFLVPIAFLKNKFNLMYKVASILEFNSAAGTEYLSKKLGVPNNYPLRLALQNAKKIGLNNIKKSFEEIVRTETKVKGYSAADSLAEVEIMLINITDIVS